MNRKTFLKKLIIFTASIILFDFLLGHLLSYFYFTQVNGKLYNLTQLIEERTDDILVFGSSRAMHHYDPEIISQYSGKTCYNGGQDGQSILYHKAVINIIVQRYKPEIIILDVLASEFEFSQASYDRLALLNPYLKRHPSLWNVLRLRSQFEWVKHLSSIYPYNSLILRIIAGNFKLSTKDATDNGFTPLAGMWKFPVETFTFTSKKELDENKLAAFYDIVKICQENNIRLYVVVSPTFRVETNTSQSIDLLIREGKNLDFEFITYSNDPDFMNAELFSDPGHLNGAGATKFTNSFSGILFPQ